MLLYVQVLKETERVRRQQTDADVVVVRAVTVVKNAEHGEERMTTLLNRVSFGVRAGETLLRTLSLMSSNRHSVCSYFVIRNALVCPDGLREGQRGWGEWGGYEGGCFT
jgi:hypothetical protein